MPLDPEIQKMMYQQKMSNWINGIAQGLMQMGNSREGVVPGLLKAVAGANTGQSNPMDALNMQMRMEQLAAGREAREKEATKEMATKTLLSQHLGKTYEPGSGMMWNQAERAIPGSAGTTDIADLGPQTAGIVPPMARRPVDIDAVMAQADPEGMLERLLAPPKDPLIRNFTVGDETITRRFDRGTREWEDMDRGPRYKPSDIDVDLSGVVGEMGTMLTDAQAGKRAVDLEDRRVAATQMASQGAALIKNLYEAGDSAISWTGGTARGLSKAASQGRALADQVGFDLNLDKFTFGGKLAEESSVIKSQLLGLAVAVTKADQGSRPSDFDVQTSLDRLAATSGSSRTMAGTIKSMLDEKMNDFAIDYRVRSGEEFDWGQELERHGIEFPELPTEAPEITQDDLEREMQRRGLLPGG